MLEKIDLSRKLGKEEYKQVGGALRERLGALQRASRAAGLPVVIIFEGWEASGKGTLINELILPLDPRGFRVHYVHSSMDDNQNAYWPPLRRFWNMIPPRGRVGIFSHSWYRLALDEAAGAPGGIYGDISSFERQLADDGCAIIKFFLHISKKEQRKRLNKMDADGSSKWRVSARERRENEKYDSRAKAIDEMIQHTDRDYAPWTLIEAHDKRYAVVKILSTVAKTIENRLLSPHSDRGQAQTPKEDESGELALERSILAPSVLKNLDLNKSIPREEYEEKLPKLQERFRESQYELYKARRPMVIAFEGIDASGKGGCIKRLTQKLDPRGYQVSPTSAPNDLERAHHYLWRFWEAFPKAGHIGIYDRSWYGRVLVERVEGFAGEDEWRGAYEEINEMEDQWVRYGAIIVKFWLHIDHDVQLARFEERRDNPEKNWKITEEDWRNREKWPLYEEAAEEMMLRTSTTYAPWTIVEANDKRHARIKVLKRAVSAVRDALGLS
ncbi:MAG: polyphosphate:AMP phosphotransferase [Clostridiales Family XIII bacterium]|jgi:polyphosphate:AMP phosphotransferase|nr:polyphosphate:AMP phosphotransferase [Clostridiales Family XIII bacterium]